MTLLSRSWVGATVALYVALFSVTTFCQPLALLPLRPVMQPVAFAPHGMEIAEQPAQRVQAAVNLPDLSKIKIPDNFNLSQAVKDILDKLPPDLRAPGSVSRDRYIVALHPNATSDDLNNHLQWIINMLSDTQLFDKDTISKFAGILQKFDSEFLRGYQGHFPDWLVALIQRSSLVRLVERDQYVGGTQPPVSNNPNVTMSGFLAAANDSQTVFQRDPPWGLDRISHREPGFQGLYVYPPNGGTGVDIYIVDTGCNVAHDDFGGRARNGASFSADGDIDGNGHGTHVSGTAAGATYGVAKAANIVAVKVLDNDGNGLVSTVIKGLEWVLGQVRQNTTRRAVINMSLGGGGTSELMNEVIGRAVGLGVPVAVAAGNNNTNACDSSPADSGVVMTVGASTETDRRASFSNFGSCVNIFAPGTNITSAWYTSNTATRVSSGTSMASPHVAGMMAVVLSLYPSASARDVYTIIQDISTKGAINNATLNASINQLLYNGINGTRFEGLGSSFGLTGQWKLDSL
ncbi:hypothetical protein SpCBS45565_g03396 [Spizellomyces sp. 'palustris']|nr:hypothetical protein SpCBS45565_g03396 [Spizellomyces sp. 'palustris']